MSVEIFKCESFKIYFKLIQVNDHSLNAKSFELKFVGLLTVLHAFKIIGLVWHILDFFCNRYNHRDTNITNQWDSLLAIAQFNTDAYLCCSFCAPVFVSLLVLEWCFFSFIILLFVSCSTVSGLSCGRKICWC